MAYSRKRDSFDTLVDIIASLRGPQGCPWDRKQSHSSLKQHLVEECYEVLEAIDQENHRKLAEELGDVLMQIVLHAQIAAEEGKFSIADVLRQINNKLVHRHPHVFGKAKVKDAQEVAHNWEELKREEREGESLLSSLPKTMPALAYSQAIQRRAASVGFDWKQADDVIKKLAEEIKELQQASNQEERAREFGDLLFALVNVARWLDVDAEEALRLSNQRFYQRFRCMEETCRERGVSLSSLPLEQQDQLWEEAKQRLRQGHAGSDGATETGEGTRHTCNGAPLNQG
ncbi:MAG: nucleoside triphosphate pyrophosphohydrolase [Chloroflexi bacterium]|nr:MAG: nucleoside triphosphate pyrophosphohydrolase [Chloroflexota bacterium]